MSPLETREQSSEYARLRAFLDASEDVPSADGATPQAKTYNGKEAPFGRIQVSDMLGHIEVQVQHPNNTWSEFMVDEQGILSTKLRQGLTVEQVLAAL